MIFLKKLFIYFFSLVFLDLISFLFDWFMKLGTQTVCYVTQKKKEGEGGKERKKEEDDEEGGGF